MHLPNYLFSIQITALNFVIGNENIFISSKLLPSLRMAITLVHCLLVSLQALGLLLYMNSPLSTIIIRGQIKFSEPLTAQKRVMYYSSLTQESYSPIQLVPQDDFQHQHYF